MHQDQPDVTRSARTETPRPYVYPSPFPQPYYALEEEFNLLHIWNILLKHRYLIACITFIATAAAVAYALLTPPTYKASARLWPPSFVNVQALSIKNLPNVTAKEVFELFKRNLSSRSIRLGFLQEQGLIKALTPSQMKNKPAEWAVDRFSRQMSVNIDDKDEHSVTVALEWGDPVVVAQLVNSYIQLVEKETLQQSITDRTGIIDARLKEIETLINSQRISAKQRRNNLIINLTEALDIASAMGLKEPALGSLKIAPEAYPSAFAGGQGSQEQSLTIPSFHHGTKALNAQIKTLKKRENDDPFIPSIVDLMEEVTFLKSVTFNREAMHAVTIDQPAYTPEHRIKPERRFIASMGLMLGLMLGVFAAFFLNFVNNARKQTLHSGKQD